MTLQGKTKSLGIAILLGCGLNLADAAEGKWTEGFGQGDLEYSIESNGLKLNIDCPTENGSADRSSSMSASLKGKDLAKFQIQVNGNTYEGPIDTSSRVGTNNFIAMLADFKKADARVIAKGVDQTFGKSSAVSVLPTYGKKGFQCNLEVAQAAAPTQAATQTSRNTTLSDQEQNLIQIVKRGAMCAGFYARYGNGASRASCQQKDMNSQLACRAVITNEAFQAVTGPASQLPPNVKQYFANNKSELSGSYSRGMDQSYSTGANANQTSQTCYDYFMAITKR